jgi:putative FmdB family regulatory protein
MPMFDFDCPDCSTRFEEIVRRYDLVPPCPKCSGSRSVRRNGIPAILANGMRSEAPPKPYNPMDKYRGLDLSTVPYVTQDGAVASHDGKILIKSDGNPVT